jgi:hypothetical protein
MTPRETRRALKSQIAATERLRQVVSGHPLMGPLLEQRQRALQEEVEQFPVGSKEARTVLFFSGEPVYGSRGIDAEFAAHALLPFLEMVKTEYSAAKHGRVGERGPRRDEDEARLVISGLPRGSFGIELEHGASNDLFSEEQLSDVLVRLTDALSAAGKSDEDFVHALENLSPRVYGRLKEFFKSLHDYNANIRMQTGDLEFSLDQNHVAQAFSRVNSVHTVENEVEKSGVFRGATLDTWTFNFRTDDGVTISGKLSPDLEESRAAEMLQLANQRSVAKLKETKVTTQGGAVRTRYELVNLTRQ